MKKTLLALLLAAALTVPTAAATFTDVPDTAWYYTDVEKAVADGLVNGKTADEYAPDANLTNAEAVKLAACMNQKYTAGAVTLQNGDPWYQSYVDYAKTAGIITADLDWSANATRAGYMAIFAHALPASALPAVNDVPDGSIPDVPMTHPQAAEIYALYRAGILQGSDDAHNCKPGDNIKRSEVAAILTRMMEPAERKTFTMSAPEVQPPVVAASAEFSGAYIDENANLDGTYMTGTVTGNYFELYWTSDHGDTNMLYWAGTFEQPNGRDSYTFTSKNDTAKTDYALLAVQAETKEFSIENGKIVFTGGMLGMTFTFRMIPKQ